MLRSVVKSSQYFRILTPSFRRYSAENAQKFVLRSAGGQRLTANDYLLTVKEACEAKETPDAEFNPPRAAYDALSSEYDALLEEVTDLRDKYRRSLAETENVRRRGQKQVEDAKVFAIQSFCKDLLEVADVLNLAVDAVTKEQLGSNKELKNFYDGVVMTKEVLLKTFSKHGLTVSSPEGEKFDPNLHEAVFQVPKEQAKYEAGHVAQVMKIGYSLHGRPVRPAQVGVVKS